MKIKFAPTALLRCLGLAVVCGLGSAPLLAEILKSDTAVFAQTDPKSPVLTKLKAGTSVTYVGDAPAGWKRIEISGPIEAYVHNRDISKGLEVKEGASIYAAPKKDAQILTTAAAGDKTDITGLRGDFCQIKLEKKIQAFIAVGDTANFAAPTKPLTLTPVAPAAAPTMSPTPPPSTAFTPGRPVQASANSADMPRMFAGRLVVAKRPIVNPNPLYDYQLMDASGRRFAYVDTKRLLITDKIEFYLDRNISLTGTIRNTVDGKDLVIAAESMQLK